MAKKERRSDKARFPRLGELRTGLGWDISDVVAHLANGKPGVSSIYRLENGQAIRYVNCVRVFDVINNEFVRRGLPALNRHAEIITVVE